MVKGVAKGKTRLLGICYFGHLSLAVVALLLMAALSWIVLGGLTGDDAGGILTLASVLSAFPLLIGLPGFLLSFVMWGRDWRLPALSLLFVLFIVLLSTGGEPPSGINPLGLVPGVVYIFLSVIVFRRWFSGRVLATDHPVGDGYGRQPEPAGSEFTASPPAHAEPTAQGASTTPASEEERGAASPAQVSASRPASGGHWMGGRWVDGMPVAPVRDVAVAERAEGGDDVPSRRRGWRPELPIRWEISAYGTLFAIALIMRLWDLGNRAVHHDESLHGFFAWELYQGNGFIHNPLMHGTFLFEGTAGMFFLFGDNEFTLRLLPAIFGSVLVLLPWLLRDRVGNVGALFISVMLAFSPTLLYFSRFARNDILMAVWTLALVGVIWRYMDERKTKWIYLAAALLALGFATKETQYLVVAILGLALVVIARSDVGRWIWGQKSLREWSPAGSLVIVVGALSLPLAGALLGFVQAPLGLTLTNPPPPVGAVGVDVGAPSGGGYAVAVAVTLVLLGISMFLGLRWNWRVWLIASAIFWFIFALLFTTVGSHPGGFGSGIWQSLGYWIEQQPVRRGDQPWYYYFMVVSVYEFLPWVIAVGAGFYYALKGDKFTRFLVFWALATFIAYTLASEKMPWLLVNITIPLVVLAGKAIGDIVAAVQWRWAVRGGALFIYAGLPIFLILVWRLIFFDPGSAGAGNFWELWGLLAVVGLLLLGLYVITKRIGRKPAFSVVLTAFVLLMAGMTVRTGWIATYINSDVPREMLIYTQTAPDIPNLMQEIRTVGELTGERRELQVTIDGRDGFTWPWAWYLRAYANVGYPEYQQTGTPASAPDSAITVVNAKNNSAVQEVFAEDFYEGRKIIHRWWFPEDYRGLTVGQFVGTIFDPDRWRTAVDFFLYREMPNPIAGVDSYVYFRQDIPLRPVQ